MLDISTFQGFLSSLAHISHTEFQIWDAKGNSIFATGNGSLKGLPASELQIFYKTIVDQDDFQYISHDGYHCLSGIPLKKGRGIIGALVAIGSGPDKAFGNDPEPDANNSSAEKMKDFLVHLADHMEEDFAAKEEMEEMAGEIDHSFEDLNLYAKIAPQIRALRFSRKMLKNLLERLLDNMRVDMAFAIFHDRPKHNVHIIKDDTYQMFPAQRHLIESLINWIPVDFPTLDEGYFIINDSLKNPQYQNLVPQPYRFLAVRVSHLENHYGWLGLVSFNLEEIFRQGELKLLISMAEQLALVIANTDLYEDLEQFIINMVKSLVFAIEAKDLYTRGHSERVSNYSMLIGERLNLDKKEHNDLKWASILHDIGKIGIPEIILNKAGRLTEDEGGVIKAHPKKGCDILRPVVQLSDALPGILHHHEHYDGCGYPQGLKGEEIPLAARIIAVVDTFDALTSDRAYRAAISPGKAFAQMQETAGKQLDASILKLFKEIYEENPGIVSEDRHAKQIRQG